MKKIFLFILWLLLCLHVDAQVNPDDELIPSLGGVNNNPVRHDLPTHNLQNRIVHLGGDQRNMKAVRKKQKELETERKLSIIEFKSLHQMDSTVDCERCFGLGFQKCQTCYGNGFRNCELCHGIPPDKCKRCEGTGKNFDQRCSLCEGTGSGVCVSCMNIKKSCNTCLGVGYINCAKCKGAGKLALTDSIH